MKQFGDHYDTRVYQTTHNVGGAITGAGVFPQNIGYNPLAGFGGRTGLLVCQSHSHDLS
jgi:hypothetical protein